MEEIFRIGKGEGTMHPFDIRHDDDLSANGNPENTTELI